VWFKCLERRGHVCHLLSRRFEPFFSFNRSYTVSLAPRNTTTLTTRKSRTKSLSRPSGSLDKKGVLRSTYPFVALSRSLSQREKPRRLIVALTLCAFLQLVGSPYRLHFAETKSFVVVGKVRTTSKANKLRFQDTLVLNFFPLCFFPVSADAEQDERDGQRNND
jgi:hypothetical protein